MENHKSKPGRNWRVLLTEVGIIVLGVSIALGAEQAVEWVHWRNEVAAARGMIASEMAYNVASSVTRLRVQDCVEQRLDEVGKILDDASRTGNLPPVGNIALPPRRGWSSGAWESVVASQTATHFSRQQLAGLARAYIFPRKADELGTHEAQNWSELGAIIGPGRRLDPATEAELRKALSVVRGNSRTMQGLSYQLIANVDQLGLPFSQSDLDLIAAARNEPMTGTHLLPGNTVPAYRICLPIGAVPPQYGETGQPRLPGLLDQGLKLLPKAATPGP